MNHNCNDNLSQGEADLGFLGAAIATRRTSQNDPITRLPTTVNRTSLGNTAAEKYDIDSENATFDQIVVTTASPSSHTMNAEVSIYFLN